VIKIEMNVRAAAAVRQSLFTDTREYTYDPKSIPPRVSDIRSVIQDLDEQIEAELKNAEEDSNS
jgi:hypothetical protein